MLTIKFKPEYLLNLKDAKKRKPFAMLCSILISFLSPPNIQPFSSLPISTPMVGGKGGSTLPPPPPLPYHWPLEGVGPETHVHKITNISVFFIWRLDLMIMMRANLLVHYSGHWKEWALIMDTVCIKSITSLAR
jgi:hypothetical protein